MDDETSPISSDGLFRTWLSSIFLLAAFFIPVNEILDFRVFLSFLTSRSKIQLSESFIDSILPFWAYQKVRFLLSTYIMYLLISDGLFRNLPLTRQQLPGLRFHINFTGTGINCLVGSWILLNFFWNPRTCILLFHEVFLLPVCLL